MKQTLRRKFIRRKFIREFSGGWKEAGLGRGRNRNVIRAQEGLS